MSTNLLASLDELEFFLRNAQRVIANVLPKGGWVMTALLQRRKRVDQGGRVY